MQRKSKGSVLKAAKLIYSVFKQRWQSVNHVLKVANEFKFQVEESDIDFVSFKCLKTKAFYNFDLELRELAFF